MVFSFGGGGTYADFVGSLSSFSSCALCLSRGVGACRFTAGVDVDATGAVDDEADMVVVCTSTLR